MSYRVIVADNAHYRDETANSDLGSFEALPQAVSACKKIVDGYLVATYRKGMPAAELLSTYKMFGEDPYIVSADSDGVQFSAWDYAEARCAEICIKNPSMEK